MAEIHGTCDERFEPVRAAMAKNLDSGADVGASVAIVQDDELVVDLWGGVVDDAGTPWRNDTIVNVFSTTKTMTNLSCLILADRGLVDLDAPVATYWPEFAANDKERVLVRHVLGHTSGVAGFDEPMHTTDLYDWDKCCARLAAQAPWWEPGTKSGYHAITQGYLAGEIIRRVTGKTPGTWFGEEVAERLDADFHIGTPASLDQRVALLIAPESQSLPFAIDPGSIAHRIWSNPRIAPDDYRGPAWRRAEIPAANGHGNARSVAQIQAIVSHGGVAGGRTFISTEGIDRIFEVQMQGQPDLGVGYPLTFGIGYGLITPALPVAPIARGCFWAGMGGSMVVNDLDRRMTIAYVMNKMSTSNTGDTRGVSIMYSAYENLDR
ncbi:MAG TPA: serine hydrolase domain-containing protein [Acidimicrobiales bacterium]|nr:serine hydrolase domain-containing protein [Acidimicrobiales bacterium]